MKTNFLSVPFSLLILLFSHTVDAQSWIGRTTGDLPYIEYSNGEVRLGADKMAFLDTAIRVEVIDSIENRYKIKLSQNWEAFIPKRAVKRSTIISSNNNHFF